jgi:thioesterase domain-containing protein/acyl carrier protein
LRSQSPANLSALEGLFPPESLERKIADLWCRVVPNAPSADCFATLDELGGDSLQAVELLVGVEKITGKRLVLSDFLLNPTLLRLIRLATSELATHDQPLCTLNQGRGRPPVFCVYGINGDISHYLALAEVLGDDQPVFGLRLPRLNKRIQLPTSMQEAGEQALECIQAITPGKAPVVVGYSWSGALAFEIARQWLLRENATPFVAMISSPAPPRPRCLAFCAWHFLRWTPAWVWKKAKEGTDWSPGWIVRNFRRFLGLWINDPTIDKSWVPDEDEAPQAIARPLLAMHDSYHPTVAAPIDIHMFRETEVPLHPHPLIPFREDYLPDLGWTYWAGRAVNVHWINADHDTLIRDPAVSILAAELRAVLDRYNAKQ